MEEAHGRPPWPPDQPAQGLSAGSPLPQLWVVPGITKPALLASDISSCQREPQLGAGAADTPSELEDNEYTMSEVMIRTGGGRGKDGCKYPKSAEIP